MTKPTKKSPARKGSRVKVGTLSKPTKELRKEEQKRVKGGEVTITLTDEQRSQIQSTIGADITQLKIRSTEGESSPTFAPPYIPRTPSE